MTIPNLEAGLCNIGDAITKASAFLPAVKASSLEQADVCATLERVLADGNVCALLLSL